MNSEWSFTDEQIFAMDEMLSRDGYVNVGEWMQDSDYAYDPDAGEWYDPNNNDLIDNTDNWNPIVDPYTQFYLAKEAELGRDPFEDI